MKTDIEKFSHILNSFVDESRRIFTSRLCGIYLHGSAVMDCFSPERSDIDLLFIVDGDITFDEKREFLRLISELDQSAPSKGLELSIVKREYCKPFVYPTPYEFHFSGFYRENVSADPDGYILRMQGTDRDLAAHFTITYHRGQVLYGLPIPEVFEAPSRADYFDSIFYDIENAAEDIKESPVYMILNLCRVLAYAEDELILSKKEGGEWGIENLPERFRELIRRALKYYTSGRAFACDAALSAEFAGFMTDEIKKYK